MKMKVAVFIKRAITPPLKHTRTGRIAPMNTIIDFLITPFVEYSFMQRALAACLLISLSATPLGLFSTLRRMALLGDAMSHAILPGVAIAFLFAGLSLWPMTIGALVFGLIVSAAAISMTRTTLLKEDSSFTLVYLICMATGVTLLSIHGNSIDLMHILFGNILGINEETLLLILGTSIFTLFVLFAYYRGFVIDCFDRDFMQVLQKGKDNISLIFFILLIINLIASYQALGTLLALGLMILPALTARFWSQNLDFLLPIGIGLSILSSWFGLALSYAANLPSGPSIVLSAGALCVFSLIFGKHGSLMKYYTKG